MVTKAIITRDEIDISKLIEEIMKESSVRGCGALACFIGFVKGIVDDRKVYELEYSVYEPYATRILVNIANEERDKYSLDSVFIIHRIGCLKPGEPTLYVIISGISREKVFKALEEIVERIKKEPPIFKLEKREDGEYWIIGEERVRRE
ncbi:MAG: molybdenum cofactor biosynthesis protein MoaE [Desulfurococcaceae archaeon]